MSFRKVATIVFAASVFATTSACGVVMDTVDSMKNPEETKSTENTKSTTVEMAFESDAPVMENLKIEVDSQKDPVSVSEQRVPVPYSRSFTTSGDGFIPLRSTRASASVADGGSYISCSIKYNDEVVATHRAEGTNSTAECEKKLRVGPQ